ncbi:hypothetical protein M422DRAFT_53755 [Sphaerobolus stellatus SS14]|uniref:Uncharacterized protein n=1 Tax=Sphaerobolus stellatus (strain SS14) TaxID=990650 RepID=A0A0C9UZA3_SPHS4|nr:hypothetical protein M422DRAFT_53755 [Sphaerobolus stellatus SS14]
MSRVHTARKVPGATNLKPAQRKGVVLALPFDQLYSQKPNLPVNAPNVGIEHLLPESSRHGLGAIRAQPVGPSPSFMHGEKHPSTPAIGDNDDHWGADGLFMTPLPPTAPTLLPHTPSHRHRN